MAIVQVEYTCPVMVLVDTQTKQITRVVVLDEDARPSDGGRVYRESGRRLYGKDAETARQIVEEYDDLWPAWDFGY